MAARVVLAPWPAALGGAIFLLIGRWLACDRDPYQFGNAWAEDDLGYCTASGWHTLTAGPASFLLACVLLLATVLWPLTTMLLGAWLADRREDARVAPAVWLFSGVGSLGVVAFSIVAGHVTIVGGAGG